jgi:hypothetical protein
MGMMKWIENQLGVVGRGGEDFLSKLQVQIASMLLLEYMWSN